MPLLRMKYSMSYNSREFKRHFPSVGAHLDPSDIDIFARVLVPISTRTGDVLISCGAEGDTLVSCSFASVSISAT